VVATGGIVSLAAPGRYGVNNPMVSDEDHVTIYVHNGHRFSDTLDDCDDQ
jgi:hypothetical protein